NVDFKDVRTVMNDSGVAIMGNAVSQGDDRALEAVTGALASPLLKDNEIEGANYILLNITSGNKEVTMDEISIITDFIQDKAGMTADLIWGNCIDENYDEELSVTIIATGFQTMEERKKEKANEKISLPLTPEEDVSFVKPVQQNQFSNKVKKDQEPFIKPVEEEKEVLSQADLFSAGRETKPQDLKDNNGDAPESKIVRHTLQMEDEMSEEESEPNEEEFELKTKPSVFEFKLPTVFDDYEKSNEDGTELSENDRHAASNEGSLKKEIGKENTAASNDANFEERLLKTKERILRLKELSMKLKSSTGLQEIENEPAYKRKQRNLEDVPHSSESQVSRFTLSFDEGKTEIRPNNSFLHDNVD